LNAGETPDANAVNDTRTRVQARPHERGNAQKKDILEVSVWYINGDARKDSRIREWLAALISKMGGDHAPTVAEL
jgi:hypothetical protein